MRETNREKKKETLIKCYTLNFDSVSTLRCFLVLRSSLLTGGLTESEAFWSISSSSSSESLTRPADISVRYVDWGA